MRPSEAYPQIHPCDSTRRVHTCLRGGTISADGVDLTQAGLSSRLFLLTITIASVTTACVQAMAAWLLLWTHSFLSMMVLALPLLQSQKSGVAAPVHKPALCPRVRGGARVASSALPSKDGWCKTQRQAESLPLQVLQAAACAMNADRTIVAAPWKQLSDTSSRAWIFEELRS